MHIKGDKTFRTERGGFFNDKSQDFTSYFLTQPFKPKSLTIIDKVAQM